MLEVKDLHKMYGSFHAVRGITFDVSSEEVVGFLGPNGAGKTTTMKIIVGFMAATAGEVKVDGLDVMDDSMDVRRRIGYLPETAPLYEDMTVTEYLRFICAVRDLKGARKKERLDHVIGVCGLQPKRKALIKTLSKGYRQRVGLAQAIIHEPKLVILDEPTVGLDPNQIIEIRELLREIGRKNTVILSSHILSEVEATCRRVLIVREGRIVADDTPAELEAQHSQGSTIVGVRGAPETAAQDLVAVPTVTGAEHIGSSGGLDRFRVSTDDHSRFVPALNEFAGARSWTIEEVAPARVTLEDVFKDLTSGDASRAAEPADPPSTDDFAEATMLSAPPDASNVDRTIMMKTPEDPKTGGDS